MICHYLDLGSASDWLKQFFFLSVITEAYASGYHQLLLCFAYPLFLLVPSWSFLFSLFPLFPFSLFVSLVPPLSPCSSLFFCSPCSPLFPLVPLFPLFPLFLLFPPFSPCSPLFPYSLLFPLSPFVSLVAPCAPCSPVSLVRLQFTTLNVLQPQISVNEKNSLRKHPFLLALRRCGRFAKRPQRQRARRKGCFRRLWKKPITF